MMTPYDYALIANEAYTAAPDIGVASSASRAIVRQTPDGLVIAFPGSDNLDCWLEDFDALQVSVAGIGTIHRGFWNAWCAIKVPVLTAIGKNPVTFVGHSLGAAIAVIAGLDLASRETMSAVYGFEPPRVSPGGLPLTPKVQMMLYRNGKDIVPLLPPGWNQIPLTAIGVWSMPFPNTSDHMMDRVLPALKAKYGSAISD